MNVRRSNRLGLLVVTIATAAAPAVAGAQSQRQAEAHGNYSRGMTSESNAWGAGGQLQFIWGASEAPAQLGGSLGGDYTKQSGGASQWNTSLDLVLQPGGDKVVTPYAGGSIGSNWSTGRAAMWSGARAGFETLAGLQVKVGGGESSRTIKVEERYGYVRGQEHTLVTRLGIVVPY